MLTFCVELTDIEADLISKSTNSDPAIANNLSEDLIFPKRMNESSHAIQSEVNDR